MSICNGRELRISIWRFSSDPADPDLPARQYVLAEPWQRVVDPWPPHPDVVVVQALTYVAPHGYRWQRKGDPYHGYVWFCVPCG